VPAPLNRHRSSAVAAPAAPTAGGGEESDSGRGSHSDTTQAAARPRCCQDTPRRALRPAAILDARLRLTELTRRAPVPTRPVPSRAPLKGRGSRGAAQGGESEREGEASERETERASLDPSQPPLAALSRRLPRRRAEGATARFSSPSRLRPSTPTSTCLTVRFV